MDNNNLKQRLDIINMELNRCVNNPLKRGILLVEKKELLRGNGIKEDCMDIFNQFIGG